MAKKVQVFPIDHANYVSVIMNIIRQNSQINVIRNRPRAIAFCAITTKNLALVNISCIAYLTFLIAADTCHIRHFRVLPLE